MSLRSVLTVWSAGALLIFAEGYPTAHQVDPTAGIRSGFDEKAQKVKELSKSDHFPDAHPAARALRQQIDKENKYIIENNIPFTKEMKEQRKADVAATMKQISDDVKARKAEILKEQKAKSHEKQHGFHLPSAAIPKKTADPQNREAQRLKLNQQARRDLTDDEVNAVREKMKRDLEKKRHETDQRRARFNPEL